MRRQLITITAAAVTAIALTACGSGNTPASAGASPTEILTPTASSDPTEEPADDTPTEDTAEEPGPETDINTAADANGWSWDDGTYDTPADEVQDICDTLDDLKSEDAHDNFSQWLVDGEHTDDGKLLKGGIPKLCPGWKKVVTAALNGTYEHWYSNGKYEVGKDIKPGTYRTKGDLEDCYWERLTRSGEIIANNFASAAREITVTVRSSDGMFTSEGCGTWKPVK